jgi:putative hydrolase of the HAD superfamily
LVAIGASAIHVPFHTTWAHERVTKEQESNTKYITVSNIKQVLSYLQ